ncbi:MAG: hypothetical protein Q7S05_02115 [bacterium]|nr:hypothetical protein [bacterium]
MKKALRKKSRSYGTASVPLPVTVGVVGLISVSALFMVLVGGGISFAQDTSARTFLTDTSLAAWTVPPDWDPLNNTIEIIGAGGDGAAGTVGEASIGGSGGGGGGGGAYAKISNANLTPGSIVNIHIAEGGSEEDTWLADDQGVHLVSAAAGKNGQNIGTSSPIAPGGQGGLATNSVGTVFYSGGAGGNGRNGNAAGGGGAAGPIGDGKMGGSNSEGGVNRTAGGGGGANGGLSTPGKKAGTKSGSYGYGGKGTLGTGGGVGSDDASIPGGNGSSGGGGGGGFVDNLTPNNTSAGGTGGSDTAFDGTHGAGGGGGGGAGHQHWENGAEIGAAGGAGGLYGGGGGGGGGAYQTAGLGSDGAQGIIIITYGGDLTPPSAPQNLSAVASTTKILLAWTASTDNIGVTSYTIYRGGLSRGSSALPSFIDTGVIVGTTYTYTVSALDEAGNQSEMSAPASVAIPLAITSIKVVTAVTGTSATATIKWSTNEKSTGEIVYGTAPDALANTVIVADSVRKHSTILAPLERSTVYYYQIRANGLNGRTVQSDIQPFTTP